MNIKENKCQLFKRDASYLRRSILREKYSANPKNIAKVQEKIKCPAWEKPVMQLRNILGRLNIFVDPY